MSRIKIQMCLAGAIFGLLASQPLQASIIVATNGTETAVKAAIALAVPGDTVQIPAGTWVWTSGKVDFSGITLAGVGTNATFLVDNLPDGGGNFAGFLYAAPTTNSLTRVTGISFQDRGAGIQSYKGKIVIDGRAYQARGKWRVDHCSFINLNGNNVFPYGNGGLIDHCTFMLRAEAISQYGLSVDLQNPWGSSPLNDSWGDLPYYNPLSYGTTNALCIEDCYFGSISGTVAHPVYDGYAGAVSVFRNNTIVDCGWYNHGNDTSGRYRSTRLFEIYNNTFINNNSWVSAMDFRGGTGVVFSNNVTGYKLFNTTENYRNVQGNSPFGGVDGSNPWDNTNSVVYFTGTNSVTGSQIVCSGANWTPHQWKGYVISDPQASSVAIGHGAGSVTFCLIQDNTADTLTMTPPKDFTIGFNAGDKFKIFYVSDAIDQVGRGSGDLLRDVTYGQWPNSVTYTYNVTTGTNTWPHQTLEPLYSWGNIMNGVPSGITATYPNLREGRDLYFNTVKPGYTPLVYPHPWGGTNGVITFTNNVVIPPTNTVKVLLPPTGLNATILQQ